MTNHTDGRYDGCAECYPNEPLYADEREHAVWLEHAREMVGDRDARNDEREWRNQFKHY